EWEAQGPNKFPCKPCRPRNKITKVPYDPRPFALPYIKNTQIFVCPSDYGVQNWPDEPTLGKPVWKVEGTSYCLNTVMTRLSSIANIPLPAETYMGAEILSWHSDSPVVYWATTTGGPARVTYFADGHAKLALESLIASQCTPQPSAPGVGPVF
ncbi:MAG: hypothetical protein ABJA67_12110, partial [Chthonomonadales bacterium]